MPNYETNVDDFHKEQEAIKRMAEKEPIPKLILLHLATAAANSIYFGLWQRHVCDVRSAKEIADSCGNECVRMMEMMLRERGYRIKEIDDV